MGKRILCLALCLILVLAGAAPGFAAEAKGTSGADEEPPRVLHISTLTRFLTFAEKCRLDSYSQGLTVSLVTDIDLTGTDFSGIPIFCGVFQGNGHTISGLTLTADGSAQGLFRYLGEEAEVYDLTVQGSLSPGGSQEEIGGIAGSNSGLVKGCSFLGSISGGSGVGGIAGVNTLTGIIEDCQARGEIHGSHFTGGIAGKNLGVIRSCENTAHINTTSHQNTVSLSDVTLETMLGAESSTTVTDIGGIAGTSSGVIRSCRNRGNVGYRHMGYNIGGIAGTQSGYIEKCENHGSVQGRKEVGGIAGQMEPAALVQYDEDALQILKRQVQGMNTILSQTAANAQNAGDALYGQVGQLQDQVWSAADSVDLLLPDPGDPKLPDKDTIEAARSGLSGSLSGMYSTLEGMGDTTVSAMGILSNNLSALGNQLNAMSATLNNVSSTLGGSIADVSDEDTEEERTGKVEGCRNFGDVLGDINAGGVTGAMAMENDLDPEEDLAFQGNSSLNFESKLRCVILNCENQGTVTAGKRAGGGIAGWQSMGLVKDCRNTGSLDCEGAQYVGGISGQSAGFIRNSSANCLLSGDIALGGIAGSAAVVTDCRSLVRLESGKEKLGAILGSTEQDRHGEAEPISGNFYLSLKDDLGGIDGVSYDGLAQPLSQKDFFQLEGLPTIFSRALVNFRFANGRDIQRQVETGGALPPDQIPTLPEKPGVTGKWEGLEEADLNHIFFDLTFEAKYTSLREALASEAAAASGKPLLLLQGQFSETAAFQISESNEEPDIPKNTEIIGSWQLSLPEDSTVTGGRLCIPEDCSPQALSVLLHSHGQWLEASCHPDGSYLVIPFTEDTDGILLIQKKGGGWVLPAVLGAFVVVAGAAIWGVRKKRKA